MAWLENIVNFVKGGIDDVRKLWINGSQKVSGMAFNADEFYDTVNNVAARKGGENGFVMLKEARDTMKDQLDTMSLKLYNNKYNVSSQMDLEKAYSNMYDEQFIRRAFDQQIYAAEKGKGLFGKEYKNFDFSDMGKNLTEDQRKTLMKDFRADYDKRLEDIYSAYVPDNMVLSQNAKLNSKGQSTNGEAWIEKVKGEVVDNESIVVDNTTPPISSNRPVNTTELSVGGGLNSYRTNGVNGPTVPLLESASSNPVERAVELHPKAGDLNFNYGMQKKYINDNVSVLDFATSADSDLRGINKAINKSSHSEELNAYRSYLNERLMNVPSKSGTWEKPDDIYSYFTKKGYNASDATELKTEYNKLVSKNIASGNPDHSGINIWEKAKKHPVIATGVVMGTAFGISELTEDDSF